LAARIVLSFDDAIVSEIELAKPVTVVGRHPDCDVVVDDAAVSGRHMLFRVVNTTVYVEDLASTNGTRVNGLTAMHQVVHHLDTIEVGRHKLHFFDDALLAGRLKGLESTVLTEFERTMLAVNLPSPEAAAVQAAARADDDLSRTMAMPRDAGAALVARANGESHKGAVPPATLALKVLRGPGRGSTIVLDRANTMIGDTGTETALVVRRGPAYYIARFAGQRAPRLNRKELGPGTHPLAAGDAIDVGGFGYEVIPAA
jgi:pSer/pThr/pTyr-binding forkhead associated (FHA) protein